MSIAGTKDATEKSNKNNKKAFKDRLGEAIEHLRKRLGIITSLTKMGVVSPNHKAARILCGTETLEEAKTRLQMELAALCQRQRARDAAYL